MNAQYDNGRGLGLARCAGLLTAFFWIWASAAPGVRAADLLDADNALWDIQEDGTIEDGTDDTFDSGLYLIVNEQAFSGGPMRSGANPRELVVGPEQMGSLRVTRKIHVPDKMAFCYFLESVENTSNQPVRINLQIYSCLGSGAEQTLSPDPVQGGLTYVAIGQARGGPRSLAYLMAGPGNKNRVNVQIADTEVTLSYPPLTLNPRQRVAFLHVCAQRRNVTDAEDFAKKFNWQQVIRLLAPEDRRVLINVPAGGLWSLGNIDLFRGEQGDAVVLTTGEQLGGHLLTTDFSIETEFGPRKIAADQVLSLFDEGRNVRLVVQNGEVLRGPLTGAELKLKLPGGRELGIPFHYVSKYGKGLPKPKVRVASEEETAPEPMEQFTFTDPIFLMRDGSRLVGKLTAKSLKVRSLYGPIALDAGELAHIQLPGAELRTPVFTLKDGTSFSGLPDAAQLEMTWSEGRTLSLDWGQLAGITFVPGDEWVEPINDPEQEGQPQLPPPHGQLRLLNEDVFSGNISSPDGTLTFDTPFGPQAFGVDQIMRLCPRPAGAFNLRVTLWDGSMFPARLAEKTIRLTARGGAELSIPVTMLRSYCRPLALPPADEMQAIEALVNQLGNNDPLVREKAQGELMQKGFGIRALLVRHWTHEDLETRTRIRDLYRKLQEQAPPTFLENNEGDEVQTGLPTDPNPGVVQIPEL